MSNISIEVESDRASAYETEGVSEGLDIEAFSLRRFDGGAAITAIVLPLLMTSLPFITKMVEAEYAARKHVKIKIDGMEIVGESARGVVKILRARAEMAGTKK